MFEFLTRPEDRVKNIENAKDEKAKRNYCVKEIKFLQYKSSKGEIKYDFKFNTLIREIEILKRSKLLESQVIWVQVMNEIINIDASYKETLHRDYFDLLFDDKFTDSDMKIKTLNILTNSCKDLHNFSENECQKLIYYLVYEMLLNKESAMVLGLILNFLENYQNEKGHTYYFMNIVDILCQLGMENFSILVKKDYNNYDFKKKNDLYSRIFETLINKFYLILPSKSLEKIILVICHLNANNSDVLWKIFLSYKLIFSDQTYAIRKILTFFNIETAASLLSLQNTNFSYTFNDSRIVLSSYNKLKEKIGDIHVKVKNCSTDIYKGIIYFLQRYLCLSKLNEPQKSPFLLNTILNYLKIIYYQKILQDNILLLIDLIIHLFGSKLVIEWEIIYDILSLKCSSDIYQNIIIQILDLKICQKFYGTDEIFRNFILLENNTFPNITLDLMKIKLLLSLEENYEKNISNILNIVLSNCLKNMSVFSYLLTFMILYIDNQITENLLIANFETFFELMGKTLNLSQIISRFFIDIIVKTKNILFFTAFTEKLLKKKSLANSVFRESAELFQRKFPYKLFKLLNQTFQTEKIKIIFAIEKNIIKKTTNIANDPFIFSLLYIFERLSFFKRNKRIFISFSNIYSNNLKSTNLYKKNNISTSSVSLLGEKGSVEYFILKPMEINTFFFDKILKNTKNFNVIERFFKFFSQQLNRIYYLDLNINDISDFVLDKYQFYSSKFSPLVYYSQNILINLLPSLNDKYILKLNIIHRIVKNIGMLQTEIFNLIGTHEKRNANNELRDTMNLTFIVKNTKFVISLTNLKMYFTVLSLYIHSISDCCEFWEEEEKKKIKDYDIFKFDDTSFNFPINLNDNKKCLNNELIELSYKVIKVVFDCMRILHYKKALIVSIAVFFEYARDFLSKCDEGNIIKIIYFLITFIFPNKKDIFYDKFTSAFKVNNFSKSKKDKIQLVIEHRRGKLHTFLVECLILSYLDIFSYKQEMHYILKDCFKNEPDKDKIDTFLSISKVLSLYKIKERENCGYYITQRQKVNQIDLKGEKFIISLNGDYIYLHTPIYSDVIKSFKRELTYSKMVSKNINLLTPILNIQKKSTGLEGESYYKFNGNSDIPNKEEGIVNIIKSLIDNPFNLSILNNASNIINNINKNSLFIKIPISTIFISNKIKFITRKDIESTNIDDIIKPQSNSKFNVLMSSLGKFEGNCFTATKLLFKTKYNLIQLKYGNESEHIAIVFVEKDNKEMNHLNFFIPEFINSKTIFVFITIYQIASNILLIKIIFNQIEELSKSINSVQKKIKSSFGDEVVFDVSKGYQLVSSYINKMVTYFYLIIEDEFQLKKAGFKFEQALLNRAKIFNNLNEKKFK